MVSRAFTTEFINFTYVDPISGELQPHTSMRIEHEFVCEITQEKLPELGNLRIDCTDKFILPGLINAHCHLISAIRKIPRYVSNEHFVKVLLTLPGIPQITYGFVKRHALKALRRGITAVRDVGDAFYNDIRFRDKINHNQTFGPHIIASGYAICARGGHGSLLNKEVGSVLEAEAITKAILAHNPDWIKIIATGGVTDAKNPEEAGTLQLSEEIMRVICDLAHAAGKRVAAHSESNEGALAAIQAGADSIEHGSNFTSEIIDLMIEHHVGLVSTLSAPRTFERLGTQGTGISSTALANNQRIKERIDQGLQAAWHAGVLIGAGTDAGIPGVVHENFAQELLYLVHDHGFTPMQALQCATIQNARLIGMEDQIGSLMVGKFADFLILDYNPLENLDRLLTGSMQVYIKGKYVNPK